MSTIALYASFSSIVIGLLICFYVAQIIIAFYQSTSVIGEIESDSTKTKITLFDCVWSYDGGMKNIWVFFVLAIVLPVFLNSISELNEIISHILSEEPVSTLTPYLQRWLYYLSLAVVGVLITLEFSYIHMLRKSAPDWIAMLLSAIVLDFIYLLVLVFVVRSSHVDKGEVGGWAFLSIFIATIIALASSLFILLLSRVSGAINDKQFDISTVNLRRSLS